MEMEMEMEDLGEVGCRKQSGKEERWKREMEEGTRGVVVMMMILIQLMERKIE